MAMNLKSLLTKLNRATTSLAFDDEAPEVLPMITGTQKIRKDKHSDGLPRVHESGCPIKPIPSALGSLNYNCAEQFVAILALIITNEYTIKNSTHILNEILDIDLKH